MSMQGLDAENVVMGKLSGSACRFSSRYLGKGAATYKYQVVLSSIETRKLAAAGSSIRHRPFATPILFPGNCKQCRSVWRPRGGSLHA